MSGQTDVIPTEGVRTGAGRSSAQRREPGELFGPRFTLFGDVLLLGLLTGVACLPVLTVPAALATASQLLGRHRLFDEPVSAGRFVAALRARRWRADLAAGAVLLGLAALLVVDAALAEAGLPGAAPFTAVLAVGGVAAAVVGLRACVLVDGRDEGAAGAGWRGAVVAAGRRAAADLPGSALVLAALATAAACAWAMLPVLFLVPGPLVAAAVAVELRG